MSKSLHASRERGRESPALTRRVWLRSRRRIGDGLDRIGFLRPARRLREKWMAARIVDPDRSPDGLPLPPADLRVLVDGQPSPYHFVEAGRLLAEMVRRTLADAGTDLDELDSVLDFGCGSGRVARQWAKLRGPSIFGCDVNAELVKWCNQNLGFMTATTNPFDPPTTFDSGQFDLVYAISILTHLTRSAQEKWLAEWRRILRPGGLLLFTTHGDAYRSALTTQDAARYDRGELVVQRPRSEGSNACSAFHPPSYIRDQLLAEWSLISHSTGEGHDVYLARAP
jgi:SAM-dependent methyltransferase